MIAERYQIVRLLGEGASARTFLCEDQVANRLVALKELRVEHVESWKHYELFEREVQVLKAIRHHGIPEVFEAFSTEDDAMRERLYLVQEFVEGCTLAERLESGPGFEHDELLQFINGLLDILAYLHGCVPPVFHRDIKPSNIILRPSGSCAHRLRRGL